ncbi:MAG: LpqB family beta-propeller domain-containing protein [Mycobacteriales bacterium]
MTARWLGVPLACLLLTGCGLPLADGVQDPPKLPAGQQQRGDIQVLPPGPRESATSAQQVRDFFGAQSNPTDDHAIARSYLSTALRQTWRDGPQVTVFEGALSIAPLVAAKDTFRVTGRRVGRIATDGSYNKDFGTLSVRVHLSRLASGRWVIDDVPNGLVLSTADRDRSFIPNDIYFLAPEMSADAGRHLVPDRQFVPVTADRADALVRRLLAGPSSALGDSVESAIPTGTTLLKPVRTDADGLVTVELSRQVADASRARREQLSAQIVWTLRGVGSDFSRLRLRGGGRAVQVSVGGADELQNRGDWGSYDPDGLAPKAPAYYIADRRLRSLDGSLTDSPVTDERGSQLVDLAAVSANDGRLGVLTRVGREWQLRIGPGSGPFGAPIWRGHDLSSPSWGRGQRGLWFLDSGNVMLAPQGGKPIAVPVDDLVRRGPYTALRVSRDGARVALVAGTGRTRTLVVGRVYVVGGTLRIGGVHEVAPGVVDVVDVSWDGPTSLVVLGRVSGLSTAVPVRVAVDGSVVAPLIRVGLESTEPRSLAAAPGRPLVVGAVRDGAPALFRDNTRQYTPEVKGADPFYPG